MRPKSMILIVIALGCGLIASIAISQVIENRAGQATVQVPTEKIYVALVDVPLGQPLNAQMVKLEEWPQDKVPEGAVRKLEDLEGRMPLARLYPGEPIMSAKLTDELNSPSQQIPKGYRVCSVKVSMDSSASGLIKPGDRVDVLVTLKRRGTEVQETETRTILRNVTVFAVNQRFNREEEEEGGMNLKTVSLLVSPDEAEEITLASELGKIKLSLRRGDDETSGDDSRGAVLADLGSQKGGRSGSFLSKMFSKPEEPAEPDTGSSIIGILKGMKSFSNGETDTSKEQQGWVMYIHSSDDVKAYNWDDKSGLPRELAPIVATKPSDQAEPVLPELVGPQNPEGLDSLEELGLDESNLNGLNGLPE